MENIDAEIRRIAAGQYGAIARSQMSDLGLTRHALRRRIASGMLNPVGRHTYTIGGSPRLAAQAALVGVLDAPDGAFLSHRSAAAWWGLPGFDMTGTTEITVPRRGAPKSTTTAHWHYLHPVPPNHVTWLKSIRVSSPALCLLQLGAVCHPLRVRRAVNNALAHSVVGQPALHEVRKTLAGSGRNGVGVLGEILDEMGDGYVPTDSGMELRLSDIAARAGVAVERQRHVGGADDLIGRVDFRLRFHRHAVIEVLSFRYHAMFLDRIEDAIRFERLARGGFEVLRIWDVDVWNRPADVAEALVAFQEAAAAISPDRFRASNGAESAPFDARKRGAIGAQPPM